ncbi:TonB-dependent receptor [Acinetobacter sp. LoGeW2-3]|uniref:TonB-dependent receptor domain-containing protein n=1 Tax=Acinetobacter sp. LoGeW2-3 TaxID=1808001 RepID=UPI000C05B4A4|nr:TonB-dependent receptor [Acinetobacter sp. LoGeW2-3]ATO18441.1 TonB-dependent receptor [Acinetobacter sp. LoGeW2-3]
MNQMYTTALGGLLVLSPLSMAMAAEKSVFQLPKINVVANLVEQKNANTLAAVTVIDREEIERKQFNSLQDLLRTIPSITYVSSGSLGQTAGVSIRGTNSNALLVLVDGQKVGSATLGQIAFEHLPIAQIERVEVVRGPRSSLYGSEAIGGVVKIYTRKGLTDGVKPFASFTYGSHETYEANAGVNIRQDNSWATLSAAGLKTQGINASTLKEPQDLDKDGYENASVSFRAGHQFNDSLEVAVNALHVDGEYEFDNQDDWGSPYTDTVNVHAKIQQNVYGTSVKFKANDQWTTELKIGRSEDKIDSFDAYPSSFETIRESASWLNTFVLHPNHTMVTGADYQIDKIKSSNTYVENERNNVGYFAQYLGNVGKVELQGALRFDDNEQFGDKTTGSATLGYRFNDTLLAYTTYGTAFRAPTFNDLYYPSSGNPALAPETSKNIEIGVKGQHKYVNWELSAFENKVDNLIAWAPNAAGNYVPSNINEARIRGAELVLGQNYDNVSWNLNYTYQDPENRSKGAEGQQIAYRPKQILNASVDYAIEQWTLGGSVHAEDQRKTGNVANPELHGFALFDTRVSYKVTPEFEVQAKLANVFDAEHNTNNGYNQDGRTAWVTLRYAMK